MRPLLVHHGRRIGQHPVIELGMEPGHRERRRPARADAHGRAAVGILGELHVRMALDQRQHFVLDELRISSRDRIVFEPSLAPLRVLAARADADCDHRRHAMLMDKIVEDREKLLFIGVAAVAKDNERSFASRDVIRRNIHIDAPRPDPGMGRRNKKVRLVPGRRLSRVDRRIEASVGIVTDHAGVEDRAVVGRHRERIDLSGRRALLSGKLRGGGMRRPDDEISLGAAWLEAFRPAAPSLADSWGSSGRASAARF